jgi:DNA-binding NtrC family response regulator
VALPPLAGDVAVASAPPEPPPRAGSRLRGRVLLVDDDEAAGGFMEDIFESWGLTVARARDGAEGRERFLANPAGYDLAVLDQSMPGMTGLELAGELATHRPGLPVILYTGNAAGFSAEDLARNGVRALVPKPVDSGALFELLRTILGP